MLLIFNTLLSIGLYANNGNDTLILSPGIQEYSINPFLHILEDPGSDISFDEIISSSSFVKFDTSLILNTEYSYWVRFSIDPQDYSREALLDWYLFIGNPEYSEIYILDSTMTLKETLYSGSWEALSKKNVRTEYNDQRVRLSLNANEINNYLIRYTKKDKHKHEIEIVLQRLDINQSENFVFNLKRDWLFLGFLITMVFLNLVFYGSTRDKAFLYHSLFILGVVLFLLDYYNISRNMFFVKDHPILIQFINLFGVALFSITYFMFIRSYMKLSQIYPNWDKLFKYVSYFMLFFMIIITGYYYTTFNERITDLIVTSGILLIYFISFVFIVPLFKIKDTKSYFIIAGTIFFMIGVAMNLYAFMMDQGMWPEMTQLGIAGEIMCFSLGLGYRFNQLKHEELEAIRIKELDEFKSRVFSNISHEFRTPLTIIKGLSELIKDSMQSGDYINIEKNYQAIDKNCDDLLNLVNQILELSKIENKFYTLDKSLIKIDSVIESTLNNFNTEASKKQITLEYINEEPEMTVELDLDKFKTIIINLISNAIKYNKISGRVTVISSSIQKDQQDYLQISVSDTGIGIPNSDQEKIFSRFHQVKNETDVVGTGIGLALVKELVEIMNGSIDVKSKVHEGSTFTIEFELQGTETEAVNEPDKVLESTYPSPVSSFKQNLEQKTLVLIVEDNQDVSDYIKMLLKNSYELIFAENGKKGLDLAIEHVPDLIITDLMMPIMNGIQMSNALKENNKTDHIPILMLTAKSSFEDKIEGLKTGADAYITKPFKKEELLVRLEKLNESRLKLQEKYSKFSLLQKTPERKKENSFLTQLHEQIETKLDDPDFNIESLASSMHMSRMQLHRKLKALSGKSASNYVRSYKLYKSKPLLEDLSKTISEVSWQVGFQDSNYFSKCFSKEFGLTPTEYRESL